MFPLAPLPSNIYFYLDAQHLRILFWSFSNTLAVLLTTWFDLTYKKMPKLGVRVMGLQALPKPSSGWTAYLVFFLRSDPLSISSVKNMSWLSKNVHRGQRERGGGLLSSALLVWIDTALGFPYAIQFSASLKLLLRALWKSICRWAYIQWALHNSVASVS